MWFFGYEKENKVWCYVYSMYFIDSIRYYLNFLDIQEDKQNKDFVLGEIIEQMIGVKIRW